MAKNGVNTIKLGSTLRKEWRYYGSGLSDKMSTFRQNLSLLLDSPYSL
jgi:hypothetical protein